MWEFFVAFFKKTKQNKSKEEKQEQTGGQAQAEQTRFLFRLNHGAHRSVIAH